MAHAPRIRPVLILALLFFVGAGHATTAVGLPNVFTPATTVDVGVLGTTNGAPYAAAEGGILVAPGAAVTIEAAYGFSDDQGPPGGSQYAYVANLRVHAETGPIGTVTASHSVSSPGAFSESGTVALTIRVPEIVRGLTVELESTLWRSGQSGGLVGAASSTAPLTVVAVPEPVAFATSDLVVNEVLDAGTILATAQDRSVVATDGHTFVSTDLGTQFTANAIAERPAVAAVTQASFSVYVTMNVNIEGGANYGVSRAIFIDHCSDWDTHACSFDAETRQTALDVVVAPSALGPRSVVTVNLHLNYESNQWDAIAGEQTSDWDSRGDLGRHVVVGV